MSEGSWYSTVVDLFPAFQGLLNFWAAAITVVSLTAGTVKFRRYFRYRHLRRVWGIRDRDTVLLVCSELDDADARQLVEPREFIYLMKYGDLDAWVEVLFSLLRLYPNIDIRLLSSGEASKGRIDLGHHVIIVGGPDYNDLADTILNRNLTRIEYRSPESSSQCASAPDEIALYDKITENEYFETSLDSDYGYFERIVNPFDESKYVILIGGCHTVGVTGAAKAFSAFSEGRRDLLDTVRRTARAVSRVIRCHAEFHVILRVRKVGATIATPSVREARLHLGREMIHSLDWSKE